MVDKTFRNSTENFCQFGSSCNWNLCDIKDNRRVPVLLPGKTCGVLSSSSWRVLILWGSHVQPSAACLCVGFGSAGYIWQHIGYRLAHALQTYQSGNRGCAVCTAEKYTLIHWQINKVHLFTSLQYASHQYSYVRITNSLLSCTKSKNNTTNCCYLTRWEKII